MRFLAVFGGIEFGYLAHFVPSVQTPWFRGLPHTPLSPWSCSLLLACFVDIPSPEFAPPTSDLRPPTSDLFARFDNCNTNDYNSPVRTSCRFGMAVHVLVVLAYREGDRVTSSLLASSVNTNPVIIRRLLLALQRAKLVETRKGAGSGSRLSRSPASITLDQVYRAVESTEPFSVPSTRPNVSCPVGNCIRRALDEVFSSAQAALEEDLAKTNLAALVRIAKAAWQRSSKTAR